MLSLWLVLVVLVAVLRDVGRPFHHEDEVIVFIVEPRAPHRVDD